MKDTAYELFLVAILLSAASTFAAEPTATAANAINALGIDLLHQSGKPGANALLSPYSIQSALVWLTLERKAPPASRWRKRFTTQTTPPKYLVRSLPCERRWRTRPERASARVSSCSRWRASLIRSCSPWPIGYLVRRVTLFASRFSACSGTTTRPRSS